MKRSPTLIYFCTKVNVPGVSLPAVNQPTPFVVIPQPGDHLEFNPFQAIFKVDEDLTNYFEIHAWLRALGKADQFKDYAALEAKPQYTGFGLKSDIVCSILNSSRNANFNIIYNDAFPTDLSDIVFDSQSSDVMTLSATVTFRYLNYDYEKVI